MSIKEEIAKVEGLVTALKNEIEVWFEKHFDSEKHAQAKAELHETLGTDAAIPAPVSTDNLSGVQTASTSQA